MKGYFKVLSFGLIELFSYVFLKEIIKHLGLSNFFALWAIISFILPIYIYFLKSTPSYNDAIMHRQNVHYVRSPEDMEHSAGIVQKTSKAEQAKHIVVENKVYIMFLIYFIINIIGFLITYN